MSEAQVKAQLTAKLKKIFPMMVVLRHEDHFTAGIPDTSISFNCRTLWLEIKFGELRSRAIQRETLRRLKGYFVTYRRDKIVEITTAYQTENITATGLGHDVVIEFVRDWFRPLRKS